VDEPLQSSISISLFSECRATLAERARLDRMKQWNNNTRAQAKTIGRKYGTTLVLDRDRSDPMEINNKTMVDLPFWVVWSAANGA
jgi:hypothetical protein